ncbi:MAG: hypothetical protein EHM61_16300 [Acidobacteria bacterium]|nr:MAG: hypothetical protein EHM61_16300 [Acidobacteriota bacterium]
MTNRNKAVVWVLAVFLLGALSGGSLVYLLMPPETSVADRGRDGRNRPSPKEAMDRLAKDLGLDAKQQEQVDKIFQETRRESHEAFKEIRAGMHNRLKQIMSPEQFGKFEKIMKDRRPPGGGDRGRSPGQPPR